MESGFVYLWFDRKHKRYYLGKHWGPEDDGYICSSTWMLRAYKRRPEDFRRRKILERVTTNRKDLAEAERRWGLLIKEEELGKRYYNLEKPGKTQWHDDPESRKTVGQKISQALTGRILSDEHKASLSDHLDRLHESHKGKKRSDKTKRKISEAKSGKPLSDKNREALQGHLHQLNASRRGKPRSEETKRKISETKRRKNSESKLV